MRLGKTLGLALAGFGLLAAAPAVAFADEDAAVQDRIRELEQQVRELRDQVNRQNETQAEPLSAQVDKYLQEMEKGSLWTDKNGKPLGKMVDSVYLSMWLRARPTWSSNYFDVDSGTDDEGFLTAFRGKLGLGARLHDNVGCFVELDWTGTWGDTATTFGNVDDNAVGPTVQQAYVTGIYAKQLGLDGSKIGRFEMQYGDEYILGETEFAATSRFYDGLQVTKNWEKNSFSADFFATKLIDGYKAAVGAPGSPDDPIYMLGFYGNYYGWQQKTGVPGGFEPYYIFVWNNQETAGTPGVAPNDTHTAGFRWYGDKSTKEKAGIGWNCNANYQHASGNEWSTDDRIMWTMSDKSMKPQVWGQFAYASGDRKNPGYNPMFQDVHGRYGWADFFGFTNLIVGGIGGNVTSAAGWTYGLEGRAIYQARHTLAEGSRSLAFEYDFTAMHKYSENVGIEFAYSYISWRNLDGADNVQRAYLQLSVSF